MCLVFQKIYTCRNKTSVYNKVQTELKISKNHETKLQIDLSVSILKFYCMSHYSIVRHVEWRSSQIGTS